MRRSVTHQHNMPEDCKMASNNRGMRGTRSPPFVVVGLLVVISILAFNYWTVSSRNKDLIQQAARFEQEYEALVMKKGALEKRNDVISGDLQGANHKLLDQQKMHSSLQERITRMEEDDSELRKLNEKLTVDAQECKQAMDQITADVTECNKELEHQKVTYEQLKRQCDTIQQQNAGFGDEKDDLYGRIESLESEKKQCTEQLNKCMETKTIVDNALQELRQQTAQQQELLKGYQQAQSQDGQPQVQEQYEQQQQQQQQYEQQQQQQQQAQDQYEQQQQQQQEQEQYEQQQQQAQAQEQYEQQQQAQEQYKQQQVQEEYERQQQQQAQEEYDQQQPAQAQYRDEQDNENDQYEQQENSEQEQVQQSNEAQGQVREVDPGMVPMEERNSVEMMNRERANEQYNAAGVEEGNEKLLFEDKQENEVESNELGEDELQEENNAVNEGGIPDGDGANEKLDEDDNYIEVQRDEEENEADLESELHEEKQDEDDDEEEEDSELVDDEVVKQAEEEEAAENEEVVVEREEDNEQDEMEEREAENNEEELQ